MELYRAVLAWLGGPLFVLAGAPVSRAELLGDVAGIACVWLVARQSLWNWPLGLINTAMWALVFHGARLYADAVLQGFFFALGVYGWWTWARGDRGVVARATEAAPLPVRRTRPREWWAIGGLTAAGTAAVAAYLAGHTDSPVPVADATVLTISLAATYGQTQKLIESWWLWIAVDVISVPLYVSRGLYPTAAVYVVFGCLCVKGLRDWRRELGAAAGTDLR